MKLKNVLLASILTVLFASACNQKKEAPPPAQISVEQQRKIEALKPQDLKLASKYNRSCFMCHANVDAKAPLTGDKTEWDRRIQEKGMQTLVANAKNGINAMPPMGQCPDCTDEDFKNLIEFMATEPK